VGGWVVPAGLKPLIDKPRVAGFFLVYPSFRPCCCECGSWLEPGERFYEVDEWLYPVHEHTFCAACARRRGLPVLEGRVWEGSKVTVAAGWSGGRVVAVVVESNEEDVWVRWVFRERGRLVEARELLKYSVVIPARLELRSDAWFLRAEELAERVDRALSCGDKAVVDLLVEAVESAAVSRRVAV